jgi:chromosome segregation ATPase
MTDTTVSDLKAILQQRLAEAVTEYDEISSRISQLEDRIADFEDRNRGLFSDHKDLYLQLANARRHESRLASDVHDLQLDVERIEGQA